MDLDTELDRLYALPLAEFIAERNALAKRVRAESDRDQADRVKGLAKPNLPAWAVNQLWHSERAAFERLLEAGSAVRAAMVGKGGDTTAATLERREAAQVLAGLAKNLLAAAGHPNTASTQQRIGHTLDAVAALGVDRLDPPLGRLTRDLEPQGFDFLAGLQLAAAPARARKKTARKTGRAGSRARPAVARARSASRAAKPASRRAGTASRSRKTASDAAEKRRREKRVQTARRELDERLAAKAAAEQEADRSAEALTAARSEAAAAAREAARAEKEAQAAAERSVAAREAEAAAAETAKAAAAAARKASAAVNVARRRLQQAGDRGGAAR